MTPSGPVEDFLSYLQIFIMLFFMITQYLAWVMPTFLKNYLNREYVPPKEEESELDEEAIMKMMEEE